MAVVAAVAFVVAAAVGYLVTELGSRAHVDTGTGPAGSFEGSLPASGALVPVYDLASDPVFPTLATGYAIERHTQAGVTTEQLARSEDGGRSWHLVGPFPFSNGYSQVQFSSAATGYAFGPAGLALTANGGSSWAEGPSFGGRLERLVPLGQDVWATYAVCHGPAEPATPCGVRLAVSLDGGRHWSLAAAPSGLAEAYNGGDILARVSLDEAYVVSYGATGGGGLALTTNDGTSWTPLPDPCSAWPRADLAAVGGGRLWMICGGRTVPGENVSAKAVFVSRDGGRHFTPVAYTGFGPTAGPLAGRTPFGQLAYAGQLSQLATISPGTAWIGVSGVGVLVTSDGGRVWTRAEGVVDTGSDSGVGVTFNDAYHGWAIEFDEGVWRTVDGVHWRLIDGR